MLVNKDVQIRDLYSLMFGSEHSKGCIPQYLRPCKILIFFAAATLDVILVS